MSEHKNQHYVPQFYLRNFSNHKDSISQYNLNNKMYRDHESIRKTASKKYFYGKDGELEHWFDNEIETPMAKIINEIIQTEKLPSFNSKEYALLLYFIVLSEARTWKSAVDFEEIMNLLVNKIADDKYQPGNTQRYTFKAEVPNSVIIDKAFEASLLLNDLKAILLKTDTNRKFITSDHPLVRYNQMYFSRKYKNLGFGLSNIGIQLFLPINSNLCICLYDSLIYKPKDIEDNIMKVTKNKSMDKLNKMFFLNSHNNVYFNSVVNKEYLQKIHKKTKNHSYSTKTPTIKKEAYRELISFDSPGVRTKINFNLFSINKKVLKKLLSRSDNAFIRPFAEEVINELNKKYDT